VLLSGEIFASPVHARGTTLLGVQSKLLRHLFQLQMAEKVLSARTGRLRGGRRSSAIRQLELERRRLGRELHTGVGQLLAAIQLQLEVVAVQLKEPPPQVVQALGRISTLAGDALEQVRSVSKRLHPPAWQLLTLESALRQLWENSGISERFEGSLDVQPLAQEPELPVKTLMYRAAQEALSNLMRHANASAITMNLVQLGRDVVLTIQDNGIGFDVHKVFDAPASLTAGIGLRSIRDQAEEVGGRLEIESGPKGTKLVITTPIDAQA
jgi:two-component system NarL family sensor kinase